MIGVFDSGLGGLCALSHLSRLLPEADLWYFADTAALPLGEKSPSEIRDRTLRALTFFEKKGADGVLLACGTASSLFTEEWRKKLSVPIFDIISPTAKAALSLSKRASLLVLATPAAVASGAFPLALARREQPVFSLPCSPLVKMAEKGMLSHRKLARVLSPAIALRPDAVVLGCTHFSLLQEPLGALLPDTRLLDAAACGAAATAAHFHGTPASRGKGERRFFATENPARFSSRASHILGYPVFAERTVL